VFVRNVPTNIRDEGGATAYNANSIFIFETAGLCIAHLGHLHHVLRDEHLARLGQVDILFVPVDGTWTMDQNAMMRVIEQIKAPVIIPMHFFSDASLLRFVAKVMDARHLGYEVVHSRVPQVTLSRETLPAGRQLLVLPGRM
jgi:L-ascorbate metabolism protein UlaG (beta-lactamase superfamily)